VDFVLLEKNDLECIDKLSTLLINIADNVSALHESIFVSKICFCDESSFVKSGVYTVQEKLAIKKQQIKN
jgi:hypothetical protein